MQKKMSRRRFVGRQNHNKRKGVEPSPGAALPTVCRKDARATPRNKGKRKKPGGRIEEGGGDEATAKKGGPRAAGPIGAAHRPIERSAKTREDGKTEHHAGTSPQEKKRQKKQTSTGQIDG